MNTNMGTDPRTGSDNITRLDGDDNSTRLNDDVNLIRPDTDVNAIRQDEDVNLIRGDADDTCITLLEMSNTNGIQLNDTIVSELSGTFMSEEPNDEVSTSATDSQQLPDVEVVVLGNAQIEIISRRNVHHDEEDEVAVVEDVIEEEDDEDNVVDVVVEEENGDENAMDQHSIRIGEPDFDQLNAIVLDATVRSRFRVDQSLSKGIKNRIQRCEKLRQDIQTLRTTWTRFDREKASLVVSTGIYKNINSMKMMKTGRRGNTLASRIRSQFEISDELCPNFVLAIGNGSKPKAKVASVASSDDTVEDSTSNCGSFDVELVKAVGMSLTGKNKKLFDNQISSCIQRQQKIEKVEQSCSATSGLKKLQDQAKLSDLKRTQNKRLAVLRNSTGITCDVLPNAINGHGNSGVCRKKTVDDAGWISTVICDGYDEEDRYVQHSSRRNKCTGCVGYTFSTMTSALAKSTTALGCSTTAIKFGGNKKLTEIESDIVLIPCCGTNQSWTDKDGKQHDGSSCGVVFSAMDPAILDRIRDENEGDRERWIALVEAKRIGLLRLKYGTEVFAFCPNRECSMNQTGFLVQAAVDHKNGFGPKPSKHMTCHECATTWCSCCSMTPYHDRKVCPGAAYAKGREMNLSGEDMAQFLRENKPCPGCNILSHKYIACDHMTCNCGTHWCWRCCEKRNPANPYVHRCPDGVDYDAPRDGHDRDRDW